MQTHAEATNHLTKYISSIRMDLSGLRERMSEVASKFMPSTPETMEETWSLFKDELLSGVNTYVPTRMTKRRPDLPWMSLFIKRQLRKRERLLQRSKRSGSKCSPAWQAYRKQRNKATKLICYAHKTYVDKVVGGSLQSTQRNSGTTLRTPALNPAVSPHSVKMKTSISRLLTKLNYSTSTSKVCLPMIMVSFLSLAPSSSVA